MGYSSFRGSMNPLNIFKVGKYNRDFKKKHPTYFYPYGLITFIGRQGRGKTYSMVTYVQNLSYEYPRAIICTNTKIEGLNPVSKVVDYEGIKSLVEINNGYEGVIYVIDEIHLEFSSLQKNIPIEVLVEISQQRKQRKHIVGTCQVYNDLNARLRRQLNTVILCNCLFNRIQWNWFVDGTTIREEESGTKMEIQKRMFFFRSPEIFESYDTFAKMKRYSTEWQKDVSHYPTNIYTKEE